MVAVVVVAAEAAEVAAEVAAAATRVAAVKVAAVKVAAEAVVVVAAALHRSSNTSKRYSSYGQNQRRSRADIQLGKSQVACRMGTGRWSKTRKRLQGCNLKEAAAAEAAGVAGLPLRKSPVESSPRARRFLQRPQVGYHLCPASRPHRLGSGSQRQAA